MASAYVYGTFNGFLPPTVPSCSITLHLYRPSGEFVCEHSVFVGMEVNVFTDQLEDGLVTPELNLRTHLRSKGMDWFNRWAGIELLHIDYIYKLVFNDVVLEDGSNFVDYVLHHGMSLDKPNDIYVVTKRWVHTDPMTGLEKPLVS
jgi:hypothetical protein